MILLVNLLFVYLFVYSVNSFDYFIQSTLFVKFQTKLFIKFQTKHGLINTLFIKFQTKHRAIDILEMTFGFRTQYDY